MYLHNWCILWMYFQSQHDWKSTFYVSKQAKDYYIYSGYTITEICIHVNLLKCLINVIENSAIDTVS